MFSLRVYKFRNWCRQLLLALFDSVIHTEWILFCSYVEMEELQKNLIITYYKQNVDTRVNNIAAFIKIASACLITSINFKHWRTYSPSVINTDHAPSSHMRFLITLPAMWGRLNVFLVFKVERIRLILIFSDFVLSLEWNAFNFV